VIRGLLLFLFIGTFTFRNSAQNSPDKEGSNTFVPLPVIFYTPETRWGFGAAGFYSWRFKDESFESRPSNFQLGGAYTLEDQVLLYLPFQLWWDEEGYSFFGELGWYRYNYFFFGVGNGVPSDFEELYGVEYPRLRLNLIKRVYDRFYLGIRLIADDFTITELDPEGKLANEAITGNEGGLNAGLGAQLIYDTRDNYFESHSGTYIEFSIDRHGAYLGSDFTYTRFRFDARKFWELRETDHLALRFFTESIEGAAPFISQALLGGTQNMRGFYEGRYRDNQSAILQAEYRRDIIWRFGMVAFGALGVVDDHYGELSLNNLRNSYGGGIRFAINPEERINIRFDVGVGDQTNFYLTIGEAF